MNNNQLSNVEKTTSYTKLVFDNGCSLRVGKADTRVDLIDGIEVIFIYPSIREREYRVRYDSTTLDKHGTTTAEELVSYWELNGFFLTNSSIVADGRVEFRDDLPIGIGDPVIGAVYLVEKPTTILFGAYTTYQSGLYIKENDTGGLSDWRRLNVKLKFTDGEYFIVNSSDQSKQLRFDVSNVSSGETRVVIWPDKDITVAGLSDIPVDSVFGRLGVIDSQDDDYSSSQIQITILDSSYFDLNFSGYGTLRTGEYQLQALGIFLSNVPFVVNTASIYNLRIKVNNNLWHSVEIDFSANSDLNNINRKFYRSGTDFNTSVAIGWNERILQPQYESLRSIDDFTNNPRVGQTTEGLINNTNVFENYLTQSFTPRRSGNFTLSSFFTFSLNDIGQDFRAQLQLFQGPTLVDSRDYVKEPKDSGSAGATLNVLSGGVIVGNANTSTNQRDGKTPVFDTELTEGLSYSLLLNWAGSENNDLAAIYLAQISIKENLTT